MKKINNLFFYLICVYVLMFPLCTHGIKKGTNLNMADIFLGIIFILYIALVLLNKDIRIRFISSIKNFYKDPLIIFAFILACVMFISTSYSLDKKLAISELIRFIVYFALYFLIKHESNCKKIKKIILCYIFSVTVVSVYGVIQRYTQIGLDKKFISNYGHGQTIRIHSTLMNPNLLGAFLILIIFPLIILTLSNKNEIKTRIMYAIITLLVMINIIMTGSRNAIIGLGVGLVVLAVIYSRKIIGYIILIGIGVFALPQTRYRILDIFNKEQNESRIKLWKTAIAMIKEHPLGGVGNGNYVTRYNEYVAKYPNLQYKSYKNFPTHNSYLKIQSELGIAGIISFLGLLACSIKKVYMVPKVTEDTFIKLFYTGFLASMVAFLAMNFFDNMFFIPQVAMSYWMIVAIGDNIYTNSVQRD